MVVEGASTASGAKIIQYTYGGAQTNDEWYLEKIEYGNYKRVTNLSYQTYDNQIENAKSTSNARYGTDRNGNMLELVSYYNKARYDILGGPLVGMSTASEYLKHFLYNAGQAKTINVKKLITEAPIAKYCFTNNLNEFLEASEKIIQSNASSFCLGTKSPIATVISPENGNYPSNIERNTDWWYSIGNANGYIVADVAKNGSQFTASLKYYVRDFYDWEENNKRGGFASDSEMAALHKGAYLDVREYEIIGSYNIIVTWTQGQRMNTGVTYTEW